MSLTEHLLALPLPHHFRDGDADDATIRCPDSHMYTPRFTCERLASFATKAEHLHAVCATKRKMLEAETDERKRDKLHVAISMMPG